MQNVFGKINTKNKYIAFFCGYLLIFIILFFSLIQLSFFKEIDKWIISYFFGALKYVFYLLSFIILIILMSNLKPHPFIKRKFIGLILFFFAISFLMGLVSFKDSNLPSFSQIIKDYSSHFKSGQIPKYFNNVNVGFISVFYLALFSLLSNFFVTFFFGYIVALIILFISISIIISNHSWYFYYWTWSKLLYYGKKSELKKKVKKAIVEDNNHFNDLLANEKLLVNEKQEILPRTYDPFDSRKEKTFYPSRNNRQFIEKQKNYLKELQNDEEIYKRAYKRTSSSFPEKNLDSSSINEFVTKTVEQNLNKTSSLFYFQNVKSDPQERKKIFKIPTDIKQNNANIKKTLFQQDRFVTPFKVLTEEEIKINASKNLKIEDDNVEVKTLTSISYDNVDLLSPKTSEFSVNELIDENDLEKNDLPNSFFKDDINFSKDEDIEEIEPKEVKEEVASNLVFYRFNDENYHENMQSIRLKTYQNSTSSETNYINLQKEVIINTFADFNIEALCDEIITGPSTLLFEIQIPSTVKINKVVSLKDNLKLNLATKTLRILAPILGKNRIGIEIERKQKDTVYLENCLLDVEDYLPLMLIYGKTTDGKIAIFNLKELPHLLIAGATGAGKSVFLNSIITNIIYWYSPNEVQLILVDPKKVELTLFSHVPHLLFPIIKEAELIVNVLDDLIEIMNDRYHYLSKCACKNITQYNKKISDKNKKLSVIILIVDELADIMIDLSKKIEEKIQKLAQLGRAAGIHLILATQRPSVNVITGTIKANIVSRISFKVGSQIDSRIILDQAGAEELLGHGDMLFLMNSEIHRIQGPIITDNNLELILNKSQKIKQDFFSLNLKEKKKTNFQTNKEDNFDVTSDPLYETIKEFVITKDFISASYLQRKYRIGFNRAASILDQLAKDNIVEEATGSRPRKVIKF